MRSNLNWKYNNGFSKATIEALEDITEEERNFLLEKYFKYNGPAPWQTNLGKSWRDAKRWNRYLTPNAEQTGENFRYSHNMIVSMAKRSWPKHPGVSVTAFSSWIFSLYIPNKESQALAHGRYVEAQLVRHHASPPLKKVGYFFTKEFVQKTGCPNAFLRWLLPANLSLLHPILSLKRNRLGRLWSWKSKQVIVLFRVTAGQICAPNSGHIRRSMIGQMLLKLRLCRKYGVSIQILFFARYTEMGFERCSAQWAMPRTFRHLSTKWFHYIWITFCHPKFFYFKISYPQFLWVSLRPRLRLCMVF